jgi:hypothetical protein
MQSGTQGPGSNRPESKTDKTTSLAGVTCKQYNANCSVHTGHFVETLISDGGMGADEM